jgi:truncated hemoglobin YjbI
MAESIGSLRLYIQPKIFKNLGGFNGIREIWLDFFKKAAKDPMLEAIYQLDQKPEERIEYLSKKYTFFLVNQTGGQVDWSGL